MNLALDCFAWCCRRLTEDCLRRSILPWLRSSQFSLGVKYAKRKAWWRVPPVVTCVVLFHWSASPHTQKWGETWIWLFWNYSSNIFCWHPLQMRSSFIDNTQSVNRITGNLLSYILRKKFSNKSFYSYNTWEIHEEFKSILRLFCYHSLDVMKLCLDFR